MNMRWGIDLGGTKIEGVVLDMSDPSRIICRKRIPTESYRGYPHILDRISYLIDMMAEEVGEQPDQIGIGTPGALDPDLQTIKNSNTTCLNGKPFKKDLEAKIGMPISIANDANCLVLAESRMGIVPERYPEARVVFGIILGTGVGGGIVIDGKIIEGRHGIGGEWGHNFLDESGGPSYSGLDGNVETILSGPALEKYYEHLSGNKLELKEIVQRYHEEMDSYAVQTINRLLHFFGKGIAVVINILDPDVIVIGGGVGNIDLLYTEGPKYAAKYVFNHRLDTAFLKPKLGDSAGVFGAAFLY